MIHLSDHFNYKNLLKAVVAPIFMMVFTSIYSIIDGLFVSNFVGSSAFAGLNLIWPVIMIIASIGFMLGTGGSALVAKKLGEGKKEEANKIFSGIVIFTIAVGFVVSLICFFFIKPIAIALGATEDILPHAVTYGKILILGESAFMVQNVFQSFSATAEKPMLGFILSLIAGLTNIILDAILIAGFKIGIAGAAVATVTAQVFAASTALIYFARKNNSLLKLSKPSFKFKDIFKAITNGSSEFLGNIAMSVVSLVYMYQLLKYSGEHGVIAYGVLIYIGFVFDAVFIGYAIGTAPIIGYHHGAKNHSEIKNILKKSFILTISSGVIMTLLSLILAKPFASIFVSYDKSLLAFTTHALRIFSFCFILTGINIFISSFFTALNNGLISAIVSIARTLLIQVSLIIVLPIIWGIEGIWFAKIVTEILAFILCLICLISNKKKYNY